MGVAVEAAAVGEAAEGAETHRCFTGAHRVGSWFLRYIPSVADREDGCIEMLILSHDLPDERVAPYFYEEHQTRLIVAHLMCNK